MFEDSEGVPVFGEGVDVAEVQTSLQFLTVELSLSPSAVKSVGHKLRNVLQGRREKHVLCRLDKRLKKVAGWYQQQRVAQVFAKLGRVTSGDCLARTASVFESTCHRLRELI